MNVTTVKRSGDKELSAGVCVCAAAVRLVGGSSYGEGRVNIYNDVTHDWTPVCDARL